MNPSPNKGHKSPIRSFRLETPAVGAVQVARLAVQNPEGLVADPLPNEEAVFKGSN